MQITDYTISETLLPLDLQFVSFVRPGLETDAAKFFIFLVTLVCVGTSAASIGFAISASVRVYAIANLLIALSFVFMMVRCNRWINCLIIVW